MTMALPQVLSTTEFFQPTPKYHNSIAMILDATDGWDEDTGDVNEYYCHTMAFYGIDVARAYQIVCDYIDQADMSLMCSWFEARQLIDILATGNWIVVTNDQGFVDAYPYDSKYAATEHFKQHEAAYAEFVGQEVD